MSASHQCHALGPARVRRLGVLALTIASIEAGAWDGATARPAITCDPAAVVAHVREQFQIHGPLSAKNEYFGFIYRLDGQIASAVVRGKRCRAVDNCSIDAEAAARQIPLRAKILGEWHTHAHLSGSRMLSARDVVGAGQNSHLSCYAAFYSTPDGEIYGWDPRSSSVVSAMGSRVSLGRYLRKPDPAATPLLVVAEHPPPAR